ncbi:MAG: ribosome maturation factor RimM [Hyphomicrobiales bacterium]
MADDRLCLGAIAGAHGVRGEVRIKTFTETPEAISAYGGLQDEAGTREFIISRVRSAKGGVVASIKGISDRDGAEGLKGTRLYVPRERLPKPDEDEFYHADLIGMEAKTSDGATSGTVKAIHNFGAGDVLEITGEQTIFIPFTRAAVPEIDLDARLIRVIPPEEIE